MTAARDPGVQPERTRLAWRRTTLTATVTTVLLVRSVITEGHGPTGFTVAALGALAWVLLLVVAHRRSRALTVAQPAGTGPRTVQMTALCTLILAIVGTVLLW